MMHLLQLRGHLLINFHSHPKNLGLLLLVPLIFSIFPSRDDHSQLHFFLHITDITMFAPPLSISLQYSHHTNRDESPSTLIDIQHH
jgi:hypothetical protein